MDHLDVRRLALILAVQAEIEGMKATNDLRRLLKELPSYENNDFTSKAEELKNLSYVCDSQLFGHP